MSTTTTPKICRPSKQKLADAVRILREGAIDAAQRGHEDPMDFRLCALYGLRFGGVTAEEEAEAFETHCRKLCRSVIEQQQPRTEVPA